MTESQATETPETPVEETQPPPTDTDNTTTSAPKETPSETATDATAESNDKIIVSSSKRSRPPYKYDPDKVTLRFLFANRDGLTVTVECKPTDTITEVKGALLSVWPEDMPSVEHGDHVRLVCMGKGYLSPDSSTLTDCEVPVFKTHPTPINVSVKPAQTTPIVKPKADSNASGTPTQPTAQGCGCVII